MDLVHCRTLLGSLLDYGSNAGSADDALDVWKNLTKLIETSCDTPEERAVAASLLFDDSTGIFHFCRASIAAQGASD